MSEFQVPTPCYLIDRSRLKENLTVLDEIRKRTGCKLLFAQKAFSCYPFYSMMSRYLDGTSATGEYEAQLAHLYFHGENHVCGAVYRPEEMEKLCGICDHIVFNSPRQLHRFGGQAVAAGCKVGLRINPELPLQQFSDYDPCAPNSRFGATLAQFPREDRKLITGLHVHALYEQNSDALEQLVDVIDCLPEQEVLLLLEVAIRKKRLLDAWYAHNVSMLLDIKILFRTVKTVFCHENLYTNEEESVK